MVSLIKSLGFGVLSPEMIKSMATVRVVSSDLYDADGYPIEGGVMDPRLGVVDPGLSCRTCGGGLDDCMGHFGYLELARPITHVLYMKVIHTLLKVTCRKCSKILAGKDTSIKELSKTPPKKCSHCGAEQGKVEFEKTYTVYEDKKEMTSQEIRERFEKISDDDLKRVHFIGGRPEWLILTLFPVPPVTMRPSITLETGERSEDDLTHKLADIVRINQSLKENIDIGAPDFILNDLWELLQYHISTYFDNELAGVPHARHRSGRPLKGIVQRLKAKEGRIRGNLLGKRVNFSARTVVSPDPRISINEVGVPEVIAKELTVAEYVTEFNLKQMKETIKDGRVNYVIRPDGRRIKITEDNRKDLIENLVAGWVIERQIRDGDISLFNRQPSLHRMSIMAHKVRIMPFRTFRISPQVCPPYNADFDGDEMNFHIPQTEEARIEAQNLMYVQNHIFSPKFGGPVIGLDLDQISGIYLLTKKETKFTKEEASQLLSSAGIDVELPDKKDFTGKEIVSFLLPKNLNMEFKGNTYDIDKEEGYVIIKNGEIKSGVLDSRAVGAFKGRILNKIRELEGHGAVKDFIDRCARLSVAYLMKRGFSIGIADIDLSGKVLEHVQEEISSAEKESNKLINDFNNNKLKALPGMTMNQSVEAQILNVLAVGLNNISEIVAKNIKITDILNMARSGSKGSLINTTQMSACVGQESILGQRIKRGYRDRTLPHFKKLDLSAESHGYVARGFKQGLTPFEVFWNIMNGREGLMDKSLRTRKSGYMQRRLVNALQDLKIEKDNSVRNSTGSIIQFLAGEDGIDPTKSSWGKLDV
ncbi:MAG: DNA-directed RNA polymerase subunit A' [Candidatus Aenigmarchaeota archaeon]|nr:DNA-directed RNA polymerase subunit A' [Candidatus Aenigmarchaeota archaeon]